MMDNQIGYIRLMNWFSPAFPVGSFAWSSGLEFACHSGAVRDADTLFDWITTGLQCGIWRNDAILLAAAFRENDNIPDINALALALAGSRERYEETTNQGSAFLEAASPWNHPQTTLLPNPIAYPVIVGTIAAKNGILLDKTLHAFLNAAASNHIQAALRLIKLGQSAGVSILKNLENPLHAAANNARNSTLRDLGSSAIRMDNAAMQHETLVSRIFRS